MKTSSLSDPRVAPLHGLAGASFSPPSDDPGRDRLAATPLASAVGPTSPGFLAQLARASSQAAKAVVIAACIASVSTGTVAAQMSSAASSTPVATVETVRPVTSPAKEVKFEVTRARWSPFTTRERMHRLFDKYAASATRELASLGISIEIADVRIARRELLGAENVYEVTVHVRGPYDKGSPYSYGPVYRPGKKIGIIGESQLLHGLGIRYQEIGQSGIFQHWIPWSMTR